MKFNFNWNLKDLDDKELIEADKPVNAGKQLAQFLGMQREGDAVKYLEWALALNKGKEIDLDTSDQDHFKELISSSKLPALLRGQVLIHFSETKASKKAE